MGTAALANVVEQNAGSLAAILATAVPGASDTCVSGVHGFGAGVGRSGLHEDFGLAAVCPPVRPCPVAGRSRPGESYRGTRKPGRVTS